jgi:hypothetical protein
MSGQDKHASYTMPKSLEALFDRFDRLMENITKHYDTTDAPLYLQELIDFHQELTSNGQTKPFFAHESYAKTSECLWHLTGYLEDLSHALDGNTSPIQSAFGASYLDVIQEQVVRPTRALAWFYGVYAPLHEVAEVLRSLSDLPSGGRVSTRTVQNQRGQILAEVNGCLDRCERHMTKIASPDTFEDRPRKTPSPLQSPEWILREGMRCFRLFENLLYRHYIGKFKETARSRGHIQASLLTATAKWKLSEPYPAPGNAPHDDLITKMCRLHRIGQAP